VLANCTDTPIKADQNQLARSCKDGKDLGRDRKCPTASPHLLCEVSGLARRQLLLLPDLTAELLAACRQRRWTVRRRLHQLVAQLRAPGAPGRRQSQACDMMECCGEKATCLRRNTSLASTDLLTDVARRSALTRSVCPASL